MAVTFAERRARSNLANDRPMEDLAPESRGGVISSLCKKRLAKWRVTKKGRGLLRYHDKVLVITPKGKRALAEPPPPGQRDEYKEKHGLRKLHGPNPKKQAQL
ncbi:MAG: hypothetical protein QOH67_4627 [Hyphomicrobiales bacterium]|nr:hypothetical protein [Hyphomicrobiales bacterium]